MKRGEMLAMAKAHAVRRSAPDDSVPGGLDVNRLRRKASEALAAGLPFMSVEPNNVLALLDALQLLKEARR